MLFNCNEVFASNKDVCFWATRNTIPVLMIEISIVFEVQSSKHTSMCIFYVKGLVYI